MVTNWLQFVLFKGHKIFHAYGLGYIKKIIDISGNVWYNKFKAM